MQRKGLGILLVLCLLACAFTLAMSAADNTAAYTEIGTPEALISLMTRANGESWAGNYRLTADITLPAGTAQNPIGNSTDKFTGIFDGNGKTVSGVNLVDEATASGTNAFIGFFGYVQGGEIRNLTLKGTVSTTGRRAGGFIGAINGSAKVEDCINYCSVGAFANAGGIVGFVSPSAGVTISGCKNYGAITGTTAANTGTGGIIGSTGTSTASTAGLTVSGCANYGAVTGTQFVGGIVGYFYGADTNQATALTNAKYKLYNCMNAGTVKATAAGQADLGGIFGIAWQVAGMHSNYNGGRIIASANATNVGGIIGRTNGVVKMAYSYNAVQPTTEDETALASTTVQGVIGKIGTPAKTVLVNNYFAAGMDDAATNNVEYTDAAFDKLNTQKFWKKTTNGPELKDFHEHTDADNNGVCDTCGETLATHTPDYVWKFDGTNYYYTCADEGCGAVLHSQTEAPTLYVDAYTKASALVGNDKNDGLSKETAVLTVEEAFRRLADVGGTVCFSDRYYVSSNISFPANSKKITVTSDPKTGFYFEKTNLRIRINGDVEFCNMFFYADKAANDAARLIVFVCNWHDVIFGEGLAASVSAYIFAGTESTADDTDAQTQNLVFFGVNQVVMTGTTGDDLSAARCFYDNIVLGSRTTAASVANVTANKEIEARFYDYTADPYVFSPKVGTLRCATTAQSANADVQGCETTVYLNGGTTVGTLAGGYKNMTNDGVAALDKLTLALNDNATVTDVFTLFNIKAIDLTVSTGAARTTAIPVKLIASFGEAYTADGTESLVASYGTHSFAADTGMADGLVAGINYNAYYEGRVTVNLTDECTWTDTNANGTYAKTCSCGRTETVVSLAFGSTTATSTGSTVRFIAEMTLGKGAAVEKYGMLITALADQTAGSGSFADERFAFAEGTDVTAAVDGKLRFAADLTGIPAGKGDTPIYAWAYVKLAGLDDLVVLPFDAVTANGLKK